MICNQLEWVTKQVGVEVLNFKNIQETLSVANNYTQPCSVYARHIHGFSDSFGIRCANAALIPQVEALQAKIIGSCGLKCTKTDMIEVSPMILDKLFLWFWSISIGNPLLTADIVAVATSTCLEGIFPNTSVPQIRF